MNSKVNNLDVGNPWIEYIEKMRKLEQAVKLTAYWTRETARATREASLFASITAQNVSRWLEEVDLKCLK